MRIALDCSSAVRTESTGVAMYIRRLVQAFADVGTQERFHLTYRLSRWKNRKNCIALPASNFEQHWILEPFNFRFGRSVDIFHGLDARLPGSWMKARLVVTIHDVFSALQSKAYATDAFRKMKEKRYLDLVRRADRIVVVSEACRKDVLQTLEPDPTKIRVIHEAAGDGFHKCDEAAITALRAKYNLQRDFFLYIGTINKRKNVPMMIRAFAAAQKKSGEPIDFVIAGRIGFGGEDIFSTIEDAKIAPHIHLLGYVADDEVPVLYSAAKGLLFVTQYEGFGIPVVEALACGCPVIGGSIGSVPEVAADAALLAHPDDLSEISTCIEKLCTDSTLREDLIFKGLQRAKKFSWQQTATQCLQVYKELL